MGYINLRPCVMTNLFAAADLFRRSWICPKTPRLFLQWQEYRVWRRMMAVEFSLVFASELQRCGIHAVAQPCWLWPIRKNVSEMTSTIAAHHFVAHHPGAAVGNDRHRRVRQGIEKAGPAGARLELRVGRKQFLMAGSAEVDTLCMIIPVFACKRALGALLPQHVVLHGGQFLFPLLFRFFDLWFGIHRRQFC